MVKRGSGGDSVAFSRGSCHTDPGPEPKELDAHRRGDGALRDLLSVGQPPETLVCILLTHGHYDHVGGLHSLLGYMKMKKRKEILQVLLPSGCRQALTLMRNFSKVCTGGMPFSVDIQELSDGDQLTVGGFQISAVGVTHCDVEPDGSRVRMPALGYRVGVGGKTVAVTGDCGDTASLRELVRGADLALIEASFVSYTSEQERSVHLTEDLARDIGSLAREYVLIHRSALGSSDSFGG